MIKIDGCVTDYKISDYDNLEKIIIRIQEDDRLKGRVITDVLVDGKPFSEIYPHQAEDMEAAGITSIEFKSEPVEKMALEISAEMPKVTALMANGARNVSKLFREDKVTDALELLQDVLDVIRDFMATITKLRDKLGGADAEFVTKTEDLSNLVTEMSEVMEAEDWVLLSDLLEYEFVPLCEDWRVIGEKIHSQLRAIS